MKIGDLYYNPEENKLVEVHGFSTIWGYNCVSYISHLHKFKIGFSMYVSDSLPVGMSEFRRKYRKIGVL